MASSVKLILSTTRSSKTKTELTGTVPRQPLPAAIAQERAHGFPVSCASPGTVHISVANPVRQGLQPGQRGDGGLLRPAQEGVLARQGLVGLDPPPALSRSSGAGSVDTIRRGAAMRSAAARRPSSAPRWEGPRNGPRNRPQSPFLPLWDSFLLGRACPKPCWERVQQTGTFKLVFANYL